MDQPLLCRYAASLYWLARYIERAENLARLLDVLATFGPDAKGNRDWWGLVQTNGDEAVFQALYDAAEPTAERVTAFYTTETRNSSSLISMVAAARENARTLRPMISTDLWLNLNVFHRGIQAIGRGGRLAKGLADLCAMVKEHAHAHVGLFEATFYRDQSWQFHQLGRYIERADQTTRLVDINYRALPHLDQEDATGFEVSQWNALLRAASGYHAFRRVHPRGMSPNDVANFLLLDPGFARSVRLCIATAREILEILHRTHGLDGGSELWSSIGELEKTLDDLNVEALGADGLHEALDEVQLHLIAVGRAIAAKFF